MWRAFTASHAMPAPAGRWQPTHFAASAGPAAATHTRVRDSGSSS